MPGSAACSKVEYDREAQTNRTSYGLSWPRFKAWQTKKSNEDSLSHSHSSFDLLFKKNLFSRGSIYSDLPADDSFQNDRLVLSELLPGIGRGEDT